MKNNILIILKRVCLLQPQRILWTLLGICLLLCGCNANEEALFWESSSEAAVIEEESNTEWSEDKTENAVEIGVPTVTATQSQTSVMAETIPSIIMVHICGAVQNPGVYELETGSRVMDAVLAADGFSKEADTEYVNLATILEDGNKVRIPTKEEVTIASKTENGHSDTSVNAGGTVINAGIFHEKISVTDQEEKNTKVNINTADKALLCTLPGIGETRAESILAYRNEHGDFSQIEDIMQISGIKESSFQKIKDLITVE